VNTYKQIKSFNASGDSDAGQYRVKVYGKDRNGIEITSEIIFNVSVADYTTGGTRYRLFGVHVTKVEDSTSMPNHDAWVSVEGSIDSDTQETLRTAIPDAYQDGKVKRCSGPGILIIYTTNPNPNTSTATKYYCNNSSDRAAFAKIMGEANADEAWSNHQDDSISVPTFRRISAYGDYYSSSGAKLADQTHYFTSTNDPLVNPAYDALEINATNVFSKTFSPNATKFDDILSQGYVFSHAKIGSKTFDSQDVSTQIDFTSVTSDGVTVKSFGSTGKTGTINVSYYFSTPTPTPINSPTPTVTPKPTVTPTATPAVTATPTNTTTPVVTASPTTVNTPNSPPVISCNPSSSGWVNSDITCNVSVSDVDNDYSYSQFAWSASTTKPGYFPYTRTAANFSDVLSSEGIWYLHVIAYDAAGHFTYDCFGPYRIDKTPPVIAYTPVSCNSPTNITVNIDVSDALSGVNTTNYKWTTSTAKPSSGWDSSANTKFSSTLSVVNTTYYLHIESIDNAGNRYYEYGGPYKYNPAEEAPEIQSIDLKMAYHKYVGKVSVPIVKTLCFPNRSDYFTAPDSNKIKGFLSAGRILAVKVVVKGDVEKVEFDILQENNTYQRSIKRLDKATRWFEWFSEMIRSPLEPSPFCRSDKTVALKNMYRNYGLTEEDYSGDRYSSKPSSMDKLDQNDNNYYNASAWPLNAVNNRYEFTIQEMPERENRSGRYQNSFGEDYTNLDIRTAVDDASGKTKIITFYYPVPYLAMQTLKTWHWLYWNTDNAVWLDIVDKKNDGKILSRIQSPYYLQVKVYNGTENSKGFACFDVLESFVNIDNGYGSRINDMLTNKNTMKSYEISDWETHSKDS
jgi:hypothetical protein